MVSAVSLSEASLAHFLLDFSAIDLFYKGRSRLVTKVIMVT